jgi:hypothetical protein
MGEIDIPVPLQLIQFLECLLSRKQHRVAKVTAACFMAKHVVEKQSLIDLVTVFLSLNLGGFPGEAQGRRAKTGDLLASQDRQFYNPAERTQPVGKAAIDLPHMGAKKTATRLARFRK